MIPRLPVPRRIPRNRRPSLWPRSTCTIAGLLSLLVGCGRKRPETAATPTGLPKDAVFDHRLCRKGHEADDACLPETKIRRADGELFTVRIVNTDTLAFDYSIAGVLVAHEDKGEVHAGPRGLPIDVVDLTQQHDKRFGGYIVRIRPKAGPAGAATPLGAMTIRVSVTTPQMNVGFGGGFTVSDLVDPPYAVQETTTPSTTPGGTPTTTNTLIEQPSRRDDDTRGMGTFVHVWHTNAPALALSFGLGLNGAQSANYYVGPSLRLGDKAYLTVGGIWGSVKTPPSGIDVGGTVKDANVLNNLGTRTARGWFAGLSYTFISGAEDALKKPFAGQGGAPPAPVTPAPPAPNTAAAALSCPGRTVTADGNVTIDAMLAPPQNGVAITWTVAPLASGEPDAGATLAAATSTTDANGKASATVNITSAGRHRVNATAATLSNKPAAECVITR